MPQKGRTPGGNPRGRLEAGSPRGIRSATGHGLRRTSRAPRAGTRTSSDRRSRQGRSPGCASAPVVALVSHGSGLGQGRRHFRLSRQGHPRAGHAIAPSQTTRTTQAERGNERLSPQTANRKPASRRERGSRSGAGPCGEPSGGSRQPECRAAVARRWQRAGFRRWVWRWVPRRALCGALDRRFCPAVGPAEPLLMDLCVKVRRVALGRALGGALGANPPTAVSPLVLVRRVSGGSRGSVSGPRAPAPGGVRVILALVGRAFCRAVGPSRSPPLPLPHLHRPRSGEFFFGGVGCVEVGVGSVTPPLGGRLGLGVESDPLPRVLRGRGRGAG